MNELERNNPVSNYTELANELETKLAKSIKYIDELSKEDFFKLLELRMLCAYTLEDETDELANAFNYKLHINEQIKRSTFQKSITNEDIIDMLKDKILPIYITHNLLFIFFYFSSSNPYELIKKTLLMLLISYTGYRINKTYILSDFHKKLAATETELYRQELSENDDRMKILEIYKEYTTKELNYATNKLLEIVPKMNENESFKEYLLRIIPDKDFIDEEELSFLNPKTKIRKR